MEKEVILYIVLCSLAVQIPLVLGFTEHTTDRFVVKVAEEDFRDVKYQLTKYEGVFYLKKVISEYYLFEDRGYDGKTDTIAEAIVENDALKYKVKHFERVRTFTIEADDGPIEAGAVSSDSQIPDYSVKHCPTFSDMGVESVWEANFTGKGVVVAITDVGININIMDLKRNIRKKLSYNFVTDSDDITPEECTSSRWPDHGNNCAGIVGAVKNKICGDGIAFDACIVGIKVFKVRENPSQFTCSIDYVSTWSAEGLVHAIDEVDIYSNSWGYNKDFCPPSELVEDALLEGVLKGRSGKGAIYVFPVGNLSDQHTNSIHTVAVNSVSGDGWASTFSAICACTLTSAYGEPCTTRTDALLTTTKDRQSQCRTDFKGTSAATAIVAGIIGLALQANPQLTWRDVQHLIVEASDATHLRENNRFITNGAGKKYHSVLGFGLLNATTLVRLAQSSVGLSNQLVMKGRCAMPVRKNHHQNPKYNRDSRNYYYEEAKADIVCKDTCVIRTENVLVTISYESPYEYFTELILTSPRGTASLLMNRKQSTKERTTRTDAVFKSVQFWGEAAEGQWIVTIKQINGQCIHIPSTFDKTFDRESNRLDLKETLSFSASHSDPSCLPGLRIRACDLAIYGTGYTSIAPEVKVEANKPPVEDTKQPAINVSSSVKPSNQSEKQPNSSFLEFIIPAVVVVVAFGVVIAFVVRWRKRRTTNHSNNPARIEDVPGAEDAVRLVPNERDTANIHELELHITHGD